MSIAKHLRFHTPCVFLFERSYALFTRHHSHFSFGSRLCMRLLNTVNSQSHLFAKNRKENVNDDTWKVNLYGKAALVGGVPLKAYLLCQKEGLYMLVILASSRWCWCPGEYLPVSYRIWNHMEPANIRQDTSAIWEKLIKPTYWRSIKYACK